MKTFAQRTALIFAGLYLVCLGIAFTPFEYNCDTYAPGPGPDGQVEVSIRAEGRTERHIVHRDENCASLHTYVLPTMRDIGQGPLIFLIGCFEGDGCTPAVTFSIGVLLVLLATSFYWFLGFVVGKILSLFFALVKKAYIHR